MTTLTGIIYVFTQQTKHETCCLVTLLSNFALNIDFKGLAAKSNKGRWKFNHIPVT